MNETSDRRAPGSAGQTDGVPGAVTILLVDDDDIDCRAVVRGLRRAGIDNPIVRVGNGLEALARLRGSDGQAPLDWPYLVLLDLNMPQMSGLEFLAELRLDRQLQRAVVFVLTTSDLERDKVQAYDHNVAGYLVKQECGDQFLGLVRLLQSFVLTVRFPDSPGPSGPSTP